ncbi:MAG: LPS export ABC transporter periplasmic protein LptC [Treponema sp.]|nr:LPS export ABC transporter periplasmic protein LptC [Treponema sp.]
MKNAVFFLISFLILFICACTFEYDEDGNSNRETPDLIMINVEYVRVRASDPIARVQAERAERYESRGIMILQNAEFEQFGERGNEVNSSGWAGSASVDINSGDVLMSHGVRLEIESEDIILETNQLDWKDDPRILSSGEQDEVKIIQENGTNLIGIGLVADARMRSWVFNGAVTGLFISDDEEDEDRVREPRVREIPEQRIDTYDEDWDDEDYDDEIK